MDQLVDKALLLLNSKIFYVPIFFRRIGETSEDIFLAITQDKLYEIKANVQEQTLTSFLKYWQNENSDEKILDIDEDYFWEYYLLSIEFCIKPDKLSFPEYDDILKKNLINSFSKNQNIFFKHYFETLISQDLNEYINNYPDELFSIPITSLYNIFYNRTPDLYYNKAYKLIIEKSSSNKDLFILLELINTEKLKEEIQIEAFEKCSEHFGFLTPVTLQIVEALNNIKDELIIPPNDEINQKIEELKIEHEKRMEDLNLDKKFKEQRLEKLRRRNRKKHKFSSPDDLAKTQIFDSDSSCDFESDCTKSQILEPPNNLFKSLEV